MTKKKRGSPYTPAPEVPQDLEARLQAVLEVIGGEKTVSQAARELGLSRPQFQSLMHRAVGGLIDALGPKRPGPVPRSSSERTLEKHNRELEKRVHELETQNEVYERFLLATSNLLREKNRATGRARAKETRQKKRATGRSDPDPEKERARRRELLGHVLHLRRRGMNKPLAALVLGSSEASVRRWARHERLGRLVPARRSRMLAVGHDARAALAALVRDTHGLVGAEALRRSVAGVSRRQAALVKRQTLTEMERERIAARERIRVTSPGVLRGYDEMHVRPGGIRHYLLVASDAAVPYRTSAVLAPSCDSAHVAEALDTDFETHGAPLACRMDRLSSHRTPEVRAVLDRHGVLLLHGPPRHPEYYGQHERQNREHRAWLRPLGELSVDELAAHLPDMRHALNALWRRPTLGFRTAEECWTERPILGDNRDELRRDVDRRAAHLELTHELAHDLAYRLAIEQELQQRGYLVRGEQARC